MATLLEERVFFWILFVRGAVFSSRAFLWVFKFIVLFVALSKNIALSVWDECKKQESEGKKGEGVSDSDDAYLR